MVKNRQCAIRSLVALRRIELGKCQQGDTSLLYDMKAMVGVLLTRSPRLFLVMESQNLPIGAHSNICCGLDSSHHVYKECPYSTVYVRIAQMLMCCVGLFTASEHLLQVISAECGSTGC